MINVDIDAQELGYNIGSDVCDQLYYSANNGMYRIHKVNLVDKPDSTNGEGVWALVSSDTSIELDNNENKDNDYIGILLNDSIYYPNLKYATVIPITTNGKYRPYVKYEWLQSYK